jgi:hypothetical protein
MVYKHCIFHNADKVRVPASLWKQFQDGANLFLEVFSVNEKATFFSFPNWRFIFVPGKKMDSNALSHNPKQLNPPAIRSAVLIPAVIKGHNYVM